MNEIMIYDLNGDSVTSLVQWDKNVTLCINEPDITLNYNVHFFNQCSKEAYVMESKIVNGTLQVKVPNVLLTEPHTIVGYVYKEDLQEGRSIYGFKVVVRNRPKPTDYVYVESDEYVTFAKVLAECLQFAENSSDSATLSKSYAVGGTETRVNENTDNAKFYSEKSGTHATNAKNFETNAGRHEQAAATSASNARVSEEAAKGSEASAQNIANQVKLEKQQIDALVKEHLVSETQKQLAEIKKYLQEIQSAKDGLSLHISGGDAFSFDVQNIHGGNAVTVDYYKYFTGNAISIV